MDLTRLQQRLQPKPDGESAVRHRTGIVDTVNPDGTVDLDLGGIVVPDVSVLDGAFLAIGDVVQVVAWAGDLLVLGREASAPGGGPLGLLGAVTKTASHTGITGTVDITGLTATVDVADNSRFIRVAVTVNSLTSTVATDRSNISIREGATVFTQFIHRFGGTNADEGVTSWVLLNPTQGSHTYKVTYTVIGTGTHVWTAAADSISSFTVEDIGPI